MKNYVAKHFMQQPHFSFMPGYFLTHYPNEVLKSIHDYHA